MKKLKLDLIKQSSIRLTTEEASSIRGGGYRKSKRKEGQCRYSRMNPELCEPIDELQSVCGCVKKAT